MIKMIIKKLTLVCAFFGLFLLIPVSARADLPNNLTNEACITCHQNYPAIKQGTIYTPKHKWDVCDNCHTNKALDSMWNCRFCHIESKFKGGSSYWLHKSPTLSESMNRHTWDSSLRIIDANFTYHNNNAATKHTPLIDTGCLGCHKNSLIEEHNGGIPLFREDFEDATYNLAFSGSWYRYNTYPFAGAYSFRNPAIGDNTSTSMETTFNLSQNGKVSFWYRVSSEANYDKFYFYLDGVEKLGGISGNVGWYQVTFPLTAGSHTMRWTYVKDEAVKWFDDCVSIDDVSVSQGGNTLDCNTCHMNSQSTVKNAINSHNTNCSACHGTIDHETVHTSNLDQSCLGPSCHNPYLSTDHKQKNIDCTICHNSTSPVVQRSIHEKDKNCGSCHSSGHNVTFTPPVPNIPLYEGYQWSAVTPLSIWKGEDWIPMEVGGEGYLIVSNRRMDVTADLVWNYYQARMPELGWTLQSPELLPGTSEFKVNYTKDGKTCVIWFHSLEDHSHKLLEEKGFKLEIIYN